MRYSKLDSVNSEVNICCWSSFTFLTKTNDNEKLNLTLCLKIHFLLTDELEEQNSD